MLLRLRRVINILRLAGILNAAVWFGGAMFFTWVAAPALFSSEMKEVLGPKNYPFYSGAVAQIIVARYFVLQYVCGAIAMLHLFFEWMFLGKSLQKFSVGLVLGMASIGLLGGLVLQPRMKHVYGIKYGLTIPADERGQADKTFRMWHGVAAGMNLILLAGLAIHVWRCGSSQNGTRFVSANKFRAG